jgi:hypothetical protein
MTNAPASNHQAFFIRFPFFDKSNDHVSARKLPSTQ